MCNLKQFFLQKNMNFIYKYTKTNSLNNTRLQNRISTSVDKTKIANTLYFCTFLVKKKVIAQEQSFNNI